MIDLIKLKITAGDGGDGKVSFHREKYITKGGPDGGVGGDGGSVILVGTRHFNTLKHLAGKKEIKAEAGQKGGRKKKHGANGVDTMLEVPLGTVVWQRAVNKIAAKRQEKYGIEHIFTRGEVKFEKYYVQKEGENPDQQEIDEAISLPEREQLTEITKEGQQIVLAQGGFGGQGNLAFKGSTNTTPLEAQYGTPGERLGITLELRLLADIGLVGYPNAGKSTLLSKLTKAHPKIADYPFTTIEPNLGVMSLPGGGDVVLADIPGLIEGASEGKGLGHDFLRHIENCQSLVFVLFLDENVVVDENLSDEEKAELVWQQYQNLRTELKSHQPEMLNKPSLVTLNKIDIYPTALTEKIIKRFIKEKIKIQPFSGFTGENLPGLISKLSDKLD